MVKAKIQRRDIDLSKCHFFVRKLIEMCLVIDVDSRPSVDEIIEAIDCLLLEYHKNTPIQF